MDFANIEDLKKSASVRMFFTINIIISIVNIVFDFYLVKATIKNKTLHKTCPILLGAYFFCQMFGSMNIFPSYAIVILPSSILDSVTIRTCAIINLIPTATFYGVSSLTLVIAYDRFLSICFPIWYTMRVPQKYHILFLSIIGCLVPFYVSSNVIRSGIKYGNLKTTCAMAELLRDQLSFQAQNLMVANSGAIICYLAIFAKFMARKFYTNQQSMGGVFSTDLQVLKAVGLILCVQIVMWILGIIFFTFFLLDSMDPIGLFQLAIITGSVTSIFSAMEVPILYFTSSLHRAALQNELNWLEKLYPKNNQVKNIVIVKPYVSQASCTISNKK